MNLIDIVRRESPPLPWAEGEKIPWNDPAFSKRMLNEHLSQSHDAASRRREIIDAQVAWIHQTILSEMPSNVLDLGCGPGLYTSRLAALGHTTTGIDFSPASIQYAKQNDAKTTYIEGDLREVDFGAGRDLVMMLFGEINVFHPRDAVAIIHKAYAALNPGGRLLLEAQTYAAVQSLGEKPPTWFTAEFGLFSDRAHIGLFECAWHPAQEVAVERYFIIEATGGTVERLSATTQAYRPEEYAKLVENAGFVSSIVYDHMVGDAAVDMTHAEPLTLVVAEKSK